MIVAFVLVTLVQVTLVLWATLDAQRFLRQHTSIDGPDSLDAFKRLARRNMVGALAVLVLGAASLALAALIVATFGLTGLPWLLGVYIPSTLLGMNLTRLERRARAPDCSNESLCKEHRKIGESWRRTVLPDF